MIDYRRRIFERFVRSNRLPKTTIKQLEACLESHGLTANSCFVVGNEVYVELNTGDVQDLKGHTCLFVEKPKANTWEQRQRIEQRRDNRLKRWLSQQDARSLNGKCTNEQVQRRLEARKQQIKLLIERRLITSESKEM